MGRGGPERLEDQVAGAEPFDVGQLQVDLSLVNLRSVQSNMRVEFGKLIVLSLLDGFEEGQCFVIAVSVRKLAN